MLVAVSYREASGPYATWTSTRDGLCQLSYQFPGGYPSAAELSELARCVDLLAGRSAHPGRPARYDETAWRSIAEAAEARKRVQPQLTWDAIARAYNVQPRTLRLYRADLRRDRAAEARPTAGPLLVTGERTH
ncbi:MAG TPA: hypothetical protein VF076_07275 [Acidimicrobiales bacterium]